MHELLKDELGVKSVLHRKTIIKGLRNLKEQDLPNILGCESPESNAQTATNEPEEAKQSSDPQACNPNH